MGSEKKGIVELGFEPIVNSVPLLVDITFFISAIKAYYKGVNVRARRNEIQRILAAADWYLHYTDKKTGRRVLSESILIEHEHERRTAIALAQMNYDVVFAPAGIFQRGGKRFDIYLLKDTIILEADLKCISSKNPLTIAYRIKEGSEQASRVVLDIKSTIQTKDLIDGLRSGTGKNSLIKEVFLFYRNKFYILPVNLIWSNRIFDILKSEKGYT